MSAIVLPLERDEVFWFGSVTAKRVHAFELVDGELEPLSVCGLTALENCEDEPIRDPAIRRGWCCQFLPGLERRDGTATRTFARLEVQQPERHTMSNQEPLSKETSDLIAKLHADRDRADAECAKWKTAFDDAHEAKFARAQAFFQGFADEMRRPSYGDQARDFGRALLLRAQEANLYTPPPPEHQ